jgi:hypothetical protein
MFAQTPNHFSFECCIRFGRLETGLVSEISMKKNLPRSAGARVPVFRWPSSARRNSESRRHLRAPVWSRLWFFVSIRHLWIFKDKKYVLKIKANKYWFWNQMQKVLVKYRLTLSIRSVIKGNSFGKQIKRQKCWVGFAIKGYLFSYTNLLTQFIKKISEHERWN